MAISGSFSLCLWYSPVVLVRQICSDAECNYTTVHWCISTAKENQISIWVFEIYGWTAWFEAIRHAQVSSIYYCLWLLCFDGLYLTLRSVSYSDPFCLYTKIVLHNRNLNCCTYCHSNNIDKIKASTSRQKVYFIVYQKETRFHVLLYSTVSVPLW